MSVRNLRLESEAVTRGARGIPMISERVNPAAKESHHYVNDRIQTYGLFYTSQQKLRLGRNRSRREGYQ